MTHHISSLKSQNDNDQFQLSNKDKIEGAENER